MDRENKDNPFRDTTVLHVLSLLVRSLETSTLLQIRPLL